MKFIVDAHLPYQLKVWLTEIGEDAIHTRDLPQKNLTGDNDIIALSMLEERIVISKDIDFYEYYILKEKPYKLLWVTTGNIRNKALLELFERNFLVIKDLLKSRKVIELSKTEIIAHY